MSTQVTIELPDGSKKLYDAPVAAGKVAEEISPRLAKAAVAADIDGRLCDLSTVVGEGDHKLRILTDRDPAALEVLRHSTAHVMAQAVRRLYGDKVQYTIGPALTDDFQYGFYYDFDLPAPISQEDLPKIEAEMKKVVAENLPVRRLELPVEQAKERFAKLGQSYKVEMIDDLVGKEGVATVSLYEQGDFVDLCRGPHVPGTGKVGAFKLLAVAGAYWRGSEANKMLTRVYGAAFFGEKDLQQHLERIEQARQRDHRVLGKQLGLFLLSNEVGPGLPLWLPNGAIIRHQLETWLREELTRRGYQAVYTPHIGKLDLYRTSGHYPYYKDSQFPPILMREGCDCAQAANSAAGVSPAVAQARGYSVQAASNAGGTPATRAEEGYLLKPMNCPHHIQIYKAQQRSYRELPVRLAEFGTVYRFEQSGELNGMIRVRGFTQDDAHIFCTPEQVESEIASCVELVKLVLKRLQLNDYHVRVSLRGGEKDKYVGDVENWEQAEKNIRAVVRRLDMNFVEKEGEAAFYGPKIDFVIKDCLGRQWQLGTIQVDYNLPERFGLEYVGADNAMHRPVMIHRAPFGSMERFIGILIEHYAGAFPLWLAPVQAAVLPVSEKFDAYVATVVQAAREVGLRVELDGSPDKIGAKIRRWTMQKAPYLFIVGQREVEAGTVSIRRRGPAEMGAVALAEAVEKIRAEAASRSAESAFA